MGKRHVLGLFAGLLLIVALLGAIRFIAYGSITGASLDEIDKYPYQIGNSPIGDSGFKADVDDYKIEDGKIIINTKLSEEMHEQQILDINFKVFQEGTLVKEGIREEVLPADNTQKFSFSFSSDELDLEKNGEIDISFKGEYGSQDSRVLIGEQKFSHLTGGVILERALPKLSFVFLVIIILFLLMVFVSRAYFRRRAIENFPEHIRDKYIKLKI